MLLSRKEKRKELPWETFYWSWHILVVSKHTEDDPWRNEMLKIQQVKYSWCKPDTAVIKLDNLLRLGYISLFFLYQSRIVSCCGDDTQETTSKTNFTSCDLKVDRHVLVLLKDLKVDRHLRMKMQTCLYLSPWFWETPRKHSDTNESISGCGACGWKIVRQTRNFPRLKVNKIPILRKDKCHLRVKEYSRSTDNLQTDLYRENNKKARRYISYLL